MKASLESGFLGHVAAQDDWKQVEEWALRKRKEKPQLNHKRGCDIILHSCYTLDVPFPSGSFENIITQLLFYKVLSRDFSLFSCYLRSVKDEGGIRIVSLHKQAWILDTFVLTPIYDISPLFSVFLWKSVRDEKYTSPLFRYENSEKEKKSRTLCVHQWSVCMWEFHCEYLVKKMK